MPSSYLLKISLLNVPHAIWRRFVVPSDIMLDQLHEVVQIVMGWQNCHMHSFLIGQHQYQSTSGFDFGSDDEGGSLPEEKYSLGSLVSKKGTDFGYWYDFGDDWIHKIVVEDTNYKNTDWPYPVCCIEGARACPPDDCGGVDGFVDFCKAMANPKHPEHKELKSWFGGQYDPEHFDLNAVNKRLGVKRSSTATKKAVKKTAKKAAKKVTKKATKKVAKKKPRSMWVFTDKPDKPKK